MENSQLYTLGQTLMDSIGPRLTGSPELDASHDWIVATYGEWGIDAANEQYGTWERWDHGLSHLDLIAPRRTSLRARPLAWTAGTEGPVEGRVLTLPDVGSPGEFREWLDSEVEGAIILFSFPQPTCRPDEAWEEHGVEKSIQAIRDEREERQENWGRGIAATGLHPAQVPLALEAAGAVAVLTSSWAGSWGTNRIFSGSTQSIPTLDVECEDYGLLARLAENGLGPVAKVNGGAEFMGETPTDNGTGRISEIGMQGFVGAGPYFSRWLARVPAELSRFIELELPGLPDEGRSDHASFVCHGVPSFRLGSAEWDYRDYTWHTNRDTFDKIALEEVRWNAILTAMLAYMASEEPEMVPRDRRVMPDSPRAAEPSEWPTCREPMRTMP